MHPTDLTVAAVVKHDSRYLLVEERTMGLVVFNQPGGHIEGGESDKLLSGMLPLQQNVHRVLARADLV